MFTEFFFLLRVCGLDVSYSEWFTLLVRLRLGLHESSLTGFYYLARTVLVKSEADFDSFDLAFLQYFKDVRPVKNMPQSLMDWLAEAAEAKAFDKEAIDDQYKDLDLDEIRRMLEERIKEQTGRHDGGNHWIGTGGTSLFGHSGYNPNGIRIGGESRNHSAIQIAAEQNFRDFREDRVLDLRQFQLAFRRLRQFSAQEDSPRDVLDLPETIQETCDNGGHLRLAFTRPRRNMVKVLLLFDSGGSMRPYANLCSTLFQAADRSKQFKALQVYFFHNCFYDHLYLNPECRPSDRISTDWVLQNIKSDYKVIVVGDAAMSSFELLRPGGCIDYHFRNEEPGIAWIKKFTRRYEKMIWMNPTPEQEWDWVYGAPTVGLIRALLPMYPLSVRGLETGLKHLMRG